MGVREGAKGGGTQSRWFVGAWGDGVGCCGVERHPVVARTTMRMWGEAQQVVGSAAPAGAVIDLFVRPVAFATGWYGCGFCQVGARVLFHGRHDFSGSQVVGESDGRTGMITHHDCGDMLEFACWLTHWLLSSWPDPLSNVRAFVSLRSLIS